MWRSRSSPGRVHSTPQPVHVAALDVTRRDATRGVTVFGWAGADDALVVCAAGLVAGAGALALRAGGPEGCDAGCETGCVADCEPGVFNHAGCEPVGFWDDACGSFATGGAWRAAGLCGFAAGGGDFGAVGGAAGAAFARLGS